VFQSLFFAGIRELFLYILNIEEMFRDFRGGGYNDEDTNVSGQRLISLILLISLAYTSATISAQKIKRMGIQKYVGRIKESKRTVPRHSSFYIGLYGHNWHHRANLGKSYAKELRLT
jgi:hypothetical protein